MMATGVNLNPHAMWRAAQTKEMSSEIMRVTGSIDKEARRTAPRTRGGAYQRSIKAYIQSDPREGIRGLVVASRHEMVIEFGWTDLSGKWHPGQYILTNALRKQQTGSGSGAVSGVPENRSLTRGRTGSGRMSGRP